MNEEIVDIKSNLCTTCHHSLSIHGNSGCYHYCKQGDCNDYCKCSHVVDIPTMDDEGSTITCHKCGHEGHEHGQWGCTYRRLDFTGCLCPFTRHKLVGLILTFQDAKIWDLRDTVDTLANKIDELQAIIDVHATESPTHKKTKLKEENK